MPDIEQLRDLNQQAIQTTTEGTALALLGTTRVLTKTLGIIDSISAVGAFGGALIAQSGGEAALGIGATISAIALFKVSNLVAGLSERVKARHPSRWQIKHPTPGIQVAPDGRPILDLMDEFSDDGDLEAAEALAYTDWGEDIAEGVSAQQESTMGDPVVINKHRAEELLDAIANDRAILVDEPTPEWDFV